jgi:uncharacterized protein
MKPTIPPISDVDSAPFWEVVHRHELQVQRCGDCDRLLFPARPICDRCGNAGLQWEIMSGRARVLSWVVTHQVFNKEVADAVPYTTLLVQLDEVPELLMYGNWAEDTIVPQAGMDVQAIFEDHEELAHVQWARHIEESD